MQQYIGFVSGNTTSFKSVIDLLISGRSQHKIVLGIVMVCLLSVVIGSTLMVYAQIHQLLLVSQTAPSKDVSQTVNVPSTSVPSMPSPTMTQKPEVLTRISQLDPAQYLSTQQFQDWSQSACSAASLAMILNAYSGNMYTVGQVLQTEITLGVISSSQGLLRPEGIDQTAAHYGFTTTTLAHPSLDQVLQRANEGTPIQINFPPQTDWRGGHFLVLLGGTPDAVRLADSWSTNLTTVTEAYMRDHWLNHYAKVIVPDPHVYPVAGRPTVSADLINQVLAAYHSPAAGKGQTLYDLGVQYTIDPAFALAFFMHESSFGTKGEATSSLSLGNLRCIPNVVCRDNFAWFASWEDGFKAWYDLIHNYYVTQRSLITVDQIIPVYAPPSDNNNDDAYISALKHAIDTWRQGQITVS